LFSISSEKRTVKAAMTTVAMIKAFDDLKARKGGGGALPILGPYMKV